MTRRIFPARLYASGAGIRWCAFRWSDAQAPYLYRLFLLKTPRFAVCLNWIMCPDAGDPHDHTSAFLSVMLRGWYDERRKTAHRPWRHARRRWWNYVSASSADAHRILNVSRGGCLTLCIMGPKVREWGYHTSAGWVHYADYAPAPGSPV